MKLSRKAKDMLNRVWRTFAQGALGVFGLTYIGPLFDLVQSFVSLGPGDTLPQVDLTFWRNALLAIVAGGAAAVISLVWNWINDYLGYGTNNTVTGKPLDTAIGDAVLGETPNP